MVSTGSSIAAILIATALFLMGNGLIGTLTPLRAHDQGFSDIAVGALGAWYYLGFVIGCFAGPRLLARVGHIRAFAVAAVLVAACVLIQPIWTNPTAWFGVRGITGFSMAILYMAVESWLNDRASNETRGQILALYVAVNLSALLLGQWLLLLAPTQSFELFSIGAILYCLCVVPMGLTRLPAPVSHAAPRIDLIRIITVSPVGAAGCLTVGLANGAFWALAPIYGQALGFSTREIALFMSVFIAGGALIQWPLGRISDGMDRRWMIAATCTMASLCGLVLGVLGWLLIRVPDIFYGIVFVFGASMLPLYSLSIAHANDRLPRAEFVDASAGLLMINAAASIPGPLLASFVISTAGPYSLFLYTALAHAAMAFYAFTRMRITEPAPAETRDIFTPVPPGSPAVLPLDPRGPAQDKSL
ncbi:MAG TPA: MFS transporter [Micropepsaceae bacterium]|nr:MFS transporter [Micropepsaceae bacterium]